MTNYERIKQMSIEEMAYFIKAVGGCDLCVFKDGLCNVDAVCITGHLVWLKQEAEDGAD